MMPNSQDSLARTIGSILRKWYDDLMSTIWGSKKKIKITSPNQISPDLSAWEKSIAKQKSQENSD